YEMSNHLPLAIRWGKGIKRPGRRINDYVSFIDFAPTFLEVAGVDWAAVGMAPSPGRSLTDIFASSRDGIVNPSRDHVLIGKERHDIGRPYDWGYPIRGIVKNDLLYIRNYEPSRWPAGNPETGYLNCDGSPTKTVLLESRKDQRSRGFWDMNFGKRPEEEMFNVSTDRTCLNNLAESAHYGKALAELDKQMVRELKEQGDPRMEGKGHVFDDYKYADKKGVDFYRRYVLGERVNAGWVNESDFESGPLD
ncbi:MAG: heparan N-sulfatase, partial [Verrucomicrobiae bacterium]|nr:heparan N-sulfatase [Verrucomicrobiae bacterium]